MKNIFLLLSGALAFNPAVSFGAEAALNRFIYFCKFEPTTRVYSLNIKDNTGELDSMALIANFGSDVSLCERFSIGLATAVTLANVKKQDTVQFHCDYRIVPDPNGVIAGMHLKKGYQDRDVFEFGQPSMVIAVYSQSYNACASLVGELTVNFNRFINP